MITEYSYKDLLEKATAANSTVEDRLNLLEWFEQYDYNDWNGECFKIDRNRDLYPVYKHEYDEDGEILQSTVVDAEIR